MIKVNVTQKHIDAGQEGVCTKCPIALALIDSGYKNAWVDEGWVGLEGQNGERLEMSRKAKLWMEDFDQSEVMKPISFTLVKKRLPLALDLSEPEFPRALPSEG